MTDDDASTATIRYHATGAYDGAGWYWCDAEYPEEGSVGAFESSEAARANARDCGYEAFEVVGAAP